MTAVRLQRDGYGGYRTPDGRFTVQPKGVANDWRLTDHSGASPFTIPNWPQLSNDVTVPRLGAARDRIAELLDAGHVPSIQVRGNDGDAPWRGACSCGWLGEWRQHDQVTARASDDARAHVAATS